MARSLGDELGVSRCHGMGGNQVMHKKDSFMYYIIDTGGRVRWATLRNKNTLEKPLKTSESAISELL